MDDREAKRAEIAERDLAALRWWQAEAERGAKLGKRTDRLHAALHLAEAWQKAKAKGLNKERFQDMVLEAMRSTHGRTESFKLANYTLPKKFSEVTEDVIRHYKTRSEPSQRLEPYLLAITIAAIHCGADPEQWKMDMLRQTSLWHNSRNNTHPLPDDNRGYENLAVLLNSLCAEIARRHELDNAYAAIKAMNCRWEMFQDRLLATDTSCMQWLDSPISPHYANCEYVEEAVPYPSVALLRIPYLVVETGFRLAPEEVLRPQTPPRLPRAITFLPAWALRTFPARRLTVCPPVFRVCPAPADSSPTIVKFTFASCRMGGVASARHSSPARGSRLVSQKGISGLEHIK